MADVKLMILGNGRVGKTQLFRRLKGLPFAPVSDSTHGIVIDSLQAPDQEEGRFNVWDFGGQDIYHGTHALFLKSRAVFILAWTPGMEERATHLHEGMEFKNFPLPYWLDYVWQFGGEEAPVIVVQTQADKPGDDRQLSPEAAAALDRFRFKKMIQFSAKDKGRGIAALKEALSEAYDQIDRPLIGPGRAKVKLQVADWRNEDAVRAPTDRQRQIISRPSFDKLCADAGNISDHGLFLHFLHNAGTVFHQPGLFNDDIVIDQGWALDAIYSVFNREKRVFPFLKAHGGRFTRADLAALLWDDAGYSPAEQEIFLDMMQSCGICFPYDHRSQGETIFIAPDLLPKDRPYDLIQKWDDDLPVQTATFEFGLLPSFVLRTIMAEIGDQAGLAGDYWQDGLFVFEADTKSRALIEQGMAEKGWSGAIVIQTQKGDASRLLDELARQVERIASRHGLNFELDEKAPDHGAKREMKDMAFISEPNDAPKCYVSYAWKDDRSDAGKAREADVDRLCTEAEARGIRIRRDKSELGFGDSISKFMRELGKGDRVFIFLSEKYLKSPNCMFELSEIWRNARMEADEFQQRVRIYTLDDAGIWTADDRLEIAEYWLERHSAFGEKMAKHGPRIAATRDIESWKRMDRHASEIGDILADIADRVQPRTFEDFLKYGFEGLLPEDEA
ncbi:COR domain-containing protein [Jiella marina]|uniref:COR domain-containing protein n=1 Tax=Jiella sp. LLJ827 TaxID=2917712 RepID=UPI0021019CB6|nr:COR domain-containing protein [Jiella sp. LLJ827]MCQ0988355.1 TIR domain-containing protein [Jiella sp. LLJ827]